MKTKNILVLGGSGEIGKKLILSLYEKNEIYLYDKNLPKNFSFGGIHIIKGDLLKDKDLQKIPKRIDIVFFLTGLTGGPESMNIHNLKKYLDYNCETLISFLRSIKKTKIKKIIFISTEQVYGDMSKSLTDINSFEPEPKNYYGVSKLMAEKILYNFYIKSKVNIDILRIPRVIGISNNDLVSRMIESAKMKNKIYLSQTKVKFNFIYINDLLNALHICSSKHKTGFRILNIFNNSYPLNLKEIANKIKVILNKNFKINFLTKKKIIEHNPLNLRISNMFTKKELNWKPLFSIDKIIKEIISNTN
jgi:UDP-glucose 4-epimerase